MEQNPLELPRSGNSEGELATRTKPGGQRMEQKSVEKSLPGQADLPIPEIKPAKARGRSRTGAWMTTANSRHPGSRAAKNLRIKITSDIFAPFYSLNPSPKPAMGLDTGIPSSQGSQAGRHR
jgi:hypothetical protein